jgi:ferredoxin-thioredoxin reductase catalytic subunit
VSPEKAKALRAALDRDAEASGYHLNPDAEFTEALAEGLLVNESRFGYRSCPCRLASGDAASDLDIVCPCDYRDADLAEWGACYCALYVSKDVLDGRRELGAVPERRPSEEKRAARARDSAGPRDGGGPAGGTPVGASTEGTNGPVEAALKVPVWRCRVCGYLCGREEPPEVCPICKAQRERFERFIG